MQQIFLCLFLISTGGADETVCKVCTVSSMSLVSSDSKITHNLDKYSSRKFKWEKITSECFNRLINGIVVDPR